MAASLSGMSPTHHVPAWKRIGLKLKYAKDAPEPNDNDANASTPDISEGGMQDVTSLQSLQPKQKKRKKPLASTDAEQSRAKRSKKSASAQSEKSSESPSIVRDSSEEPVPGETYPFRKKSVSFTAETKEEDGSSATKLSKAWFSQQQADQSHIQTDSPEETSDSVKVTTETGNSKATSPDGPQATQQPQRKKRAKNRTKTTPQEPETAYVNYLITFYLDRSSWKFNKSKQNDLLKNFWNIYRIHPDHNDALYSYIAGLQGAAAAKRLHEGAENVLSEIAKSQKTKIYDMESSAARKAAYEAALERQIQIYEASGAGRNEHDDRQLEELEELRQSVERGRRALGILDLVAEKAGILEQVQSTSTERSISTLAQGSGTSGCTTAPSNRKKRKARTQVSSNEDSSSDSSDSDTESSDDSTSSESDSSSSGSSTE